jgi:hypothetical protein
LIIRSALLLTGVAFAVLLSADLLLWLALPILPEVITQLGLGLLLSAFSLLLMKGLWALSQSIIHACQLYFSAKQRAQRRLLFIQAQQERLKQLFYLRTVQIGYFSRLRRVRLLNANNRKHINALSNAINKDLLSVKQQLAKSTYLQLQRENSHYRKQQDGEALIKLQQKISTLV